MGVRGVTKFVRTKCQSRRLEICSASEAVIAIDGTGLVYHISACMNWENELDIFANSVNEYFTNLKRAGIRAVVFMDNPYKVAEDKVPCTLARRGDAMKEMQSGRTTNLPLLAMEAFMQTLSDNGIEWEIVASESDTEIARFTQSNDVITVLTCDSDFFIFNIPSVTFFEDLLFVPDDTVVIRSYTPDQIFSALKLPRGLFYRSIFAALIGYDRSPCLRSIHQTLFHFKRLRDPDLRLALVKRLSLNVDPKEALTSKITINFQDLLVAAGRFLRVVDEVATKLNLLTESEIVNAISKMLLYSDSSYFTRTVKWFSCTDNVELVNKSWWWPHPGVGECFHTELGTVYVFEVLRPLRKNLIGHESEYGPYSASEYQLTCWNSNQETPIVFEELKRAFEFSHFAAVAFQCLHFYSCDHAADWKKCNVCSNPWERHVFGDICILNNVTPDTSNERFLFLLNLVESSILLCHVYNAPIRLNDFSQKIFAEKYNNEYNI